MSIEFISRMIGMVVFCVIGVYVGFELAQSFGGMQELWAVVFGLIGVLFGLVLTPILTVRPIRSIRARLASISAQSLIAGITGLIVSLIIAGLLALPLSMLP